MFDHSVVTSAEHVERERLVHREPGTLSISCYLTVMSLTAHSTFNLSLLHHHLSEPIRAQYETECDVTKETSCVQMLNIYRSSSNWILNFLEVRSIVIDIFTVDRTLNTLINMKNVCYSERVCSLAGQHQQEVVISEEELQMTSWFCGDC